MQTRLFHYCLFNIIIHDCRYIVVCVDAKLNFDDFAAYRQPNIFAMDDQAEMDGREADAQRCQLNYVGLDGNIACLGMFLSHLDRIYVYDELIVVSEWRRTCDGYNGHY